VVVSPLDSLFSLELRSELSPECCDSAVDPSSLEEAVEFALESSTVPVESELAGFEVDVVESDELVSSSVDGYAGSTTQAKPAMNTHDDPKAKKEELNRSIEK
jgi:hypothetical protein